MFPFQKSDELCLRNASDPSKHDEIQQDPISSYVVFDQTQNSVDFVEKKDEISEGIELKEKERITRKEVERRRRKEMSELFVSLRSLLPLEIIKGKRSKSDHMHGAVNYIKQLENNIQELVIKRDELNKLSSNSQVTPTKTPNNYLPRVTVDLYQDSLEVLINCSSGEDEIPLSRVLRVLYEEGLNVVSLVSAQVNERLLKTIKCEVSDMMLDSSLLQQKLNNVLVP